MEISITKVNGKSINLELDDSSDTINLKIHGLTCKLVLRLGPKLDSDSDSEPGPTMRIFVSTLGGKTFDLNVEETDNTEIVKNKIRGLDGPPVDQQILIFKGIKLLSRRTLASYGIKSGSDLLMMSQLCGC
ncbi:hypothetical protein EUTSA_v10028252mg [Eutrema salsugineum]|uniref:Ubiquitin-like domain-containing protein n=1 Tax=Eutrema salsugineum TaxID=72664 RepID=V4M466_EUTSA|nr:polyubiquitin [Eutrema salsugineum]ESQ47028.1 hypothetical protein EUTSA_v10028252mg [Eutrema salsugineum]